MCLTIVRYPAEKPCTNKNEIHALLLHSYATSNMLVPEHFTKQLSLSNFGHNTTNWWYPTYVFTLCLCTLTLRHHVVKQISRQCCKHTFTMSDEVRISVKENI